MALLGHLTRHSRYIQQQMETVSSNIAAPCIEIIPHGRMTGKDFTAALQELKDKYGNDEGKIAMWTRPEALRSQ
eukprot:9596398-Prorocentrum_lima.AAC.1